MSSLITHILTVSCTEIAGCRPKQPAYKIFQQNREIFRLAVDMDIHGYIHVWISDFRHYVDISMDIVLSHLLIKLNILVFYSYLIFFCLSFFIFSFIYVIESNE